MKCKPSIVIMCLFLAAFLFARSAQALTFGGSSGGSGEGMVFNLLPDAQIKYRPASGQAPLWVWFAADVSYADKVTWIVEDFVDPSKQPQWGENDLAIAYRYDYPGIFLVTLIAENTWGVAIDTAYVWVDQGAISVDIAVTPASPTIDQEVSFTSDIFTFQKALVLDSYSWSFGNGKGSTDRAPKTTYEVAGTYLVSLTVKDSTGLYTATDEQLITVGTGPQPIPSFEASPRSGAVDTVVYFVNTTRGEYDSSLWDFGDGTGSTEKDPSHKYESEGTYTVILTVSSSSGSVSEIKQNYITIGETGVPVVNVDFYAAPTKSLAGENVYFFNNTTGSYKASLWSFGDGTGSDAKNPTHSYQTPGVYSVTLEVVLTDGGSARRTKSNYITVLVASTPAAAVEPLFVADPVSGTSPHTVQFDNLSTTDLQDVWWDFGDGATSQEINPLHTYQQPGNYTVTLFVGNDAKTKLDYIYTVPESGDDQTPAGLLLSGDPAGLQTVGDFRDAIIARSLYGTGLMELYYKYALELVTILQQDTGLYAEVQTLLNSYLPLFEAALINGRLVIPQEQRPAIITVLGKIADQAGPELSEALIKLMKDLDNNEFFQSINRHASTN